MTKITAVLVAFNREKLLREALEALAAQRRPVDRLVVVDNASSDGSRAVAEELLEAWGERARFIPLEENTGGAGGFAVGIAAALTEQDVDWVWVMDDDTVPGPEALSGRSTRTRPTSVQAPMTWRSWVRASCGPTVTITQ